MRTKQSGPNFIPSVQSSTFGLVQKIYTTIDLHPAHILKRTEPEIINFAASKSLCLMGFILNGLWLLTLLVAVITTKSLLAPIISCNLSFTVYILIYVE